MQGRSSKWVIPRESSVSEGSWLCAAAVSTRHSTVVDLEGSSELSTVTFTAKVPMSRRYHKPRPHDKEDGVRPNSKQQKPSSRFSAVRWREPHFRVSHADTKWRSLVARSSAAIQLVALLELLLKSAAPWQLKPFLHRAA